MSKGVKHFANLVRVEKDKKGKSIPIYRISTVDIKQVKKEQSEIKRVTL